MTSNIGNLRELYERYKLSQRPSQSSESQGWSNSQESQSFSQELLDDDLPRRKSNDTSSQILLQILCELAQLKAKIDSYDSTEMQKGILVLAQTMRETNSAVDKLQQKIETIEKKISSDINTHFVEGFAQINESLTSCITKTMSQCKDELIQTMKQSLNESVVEHQKISLKDNIEWNNLLFENSKIHKQLHSIQENISVQQRDLSSSFKADIEILTGKVTAMIEKQELQVAPE